VAQLALAVCIMVFVAKAAADYCQLFAAGSKSATASQWTEQHHVFLLAKAAADYCQLFAAGSRPATAS
jgi:TorA maturation chaperone TorD